MIIFFNICDYKCRMNLSLLKSYIKCKEFVHSSLCRKLLSQLLNLPSFKLLFYWERKNKKIYIYKFYHALKGKAVRL